MHMDCHGVGMQAVAPELDAPNDRRHVHGECRHLQLALSIHENRSDTDSIYGIAGHLPKHLRVTDRGMQLVQGQYLCSGHARASTY
jgi:hypothetical protein